MSKEIKFGPGLW